MKANNPPRSFAIEIARATRARDLLNFHREHLTQYLWPRTIEEFEQLALDECLYDAVETTGRRRRVVGLCYVMSGTEPDSTQTPRAEFGGIYVSDDCRGLGVATSLGVVAISNHFVWDPPRGRMIAHVHVDNPLPRGMLQGPLGFKHVGRETPPREVVPANMKRDENGDVVGDLFEFQPCTLAAFADWIETFDGEIKGGAARSKLRVDLPMMTVFRMQTVSALRDLSNR